MFQLPSVVRLGTTAGTSALYWRY